MSVIGSRPLYRLWGTLLVLTLSTPLAARSQVVRPEAEKHHPQSTPTEIPGLVDGAKNPEQIPHHVAYRIFLRSLVHPKEDDLKQYQDPGAVVAARTAYARQLFTQLGMNAKEVADFLVVVEEFGDRMEELDRQAAEVKDIAWPDPDPLVVAQLIDLQRQNDDAVRDVMRTLSQRIGSAAATRLDAHIGAHVKRRIKMAKGPLDSPAQRALAGTAISQEPHR